MNASISYPDLIREKSVTVPPVGIPNPPSLNSNLFDFQETVTRWALRRGRAALFLDTGLGKSWCALEWARVVSEHTGRPVLILTPLAVAPQFVSEGRKIDVNVTLCRDGSDVGSGVNICNYDRLERFDCSVFGGVVLDESSILKNFNGKTRNALIDEFRECRFKLCTTATPAPNDHTELGNHAEFLGVMSRLEMLSMFFCHDGGSTQDWRLKGHARGDFWGWVASWALAIRSPKDLGFDGSRYQLPPMSIEQVTVDSSDALAKESGMLLGYQAATLSEQRAARRESMDRRVKAAADLVNGSSDPWIVWCDMNDESTALARAIPDAVEVRGSDKTEAKEAAIADFIDGSARVLVTKPSICGMGLNMQHCAHSAFVGLGYSWELYYQAIRRIYRFGQKRPVTIKVITSEAEGRVVDAIRRKQEDADAMAVGMIEHMRDVMRAEIQATDITRDEYQPMKVLEVPTWLAK